MKQIRHFLVLVAALLMATASCQQAPFLTMNGPKSFNFSRVGGSQSITFSTNKDWSVRSSESWCKVSPASGSAADGNVTVTVTVDKNTGYDPRTCTLTVKVEELTETVSVSQDMGLGLIVSPTTLNLTNAAQDFEIEVQKNVSYTVNMDEIAKTFITYNGTKGLTSEKASFSVAANDTYDDREGVLIFQQTGGDLLQTVIVKQSQTNGLFITTPEYDLSNEAHTLTVEVKANVEFEVTSQADWIKYVSTSTKALMPSQITLDVAANDTYDDRDGQVIVKQKGGDLVGTIIIRQDENYGIFVSKESVSINKEEQKVEVEVKYNVDFEVIIPSDAQGKMISTVEYSDGNEGTKALATRIYSFGVTENTDYEPREVNITFKQRDGALSGTLTICQEATDYIGNTYSVFYVGVKGGNVEIPLIHNNDYEVSISDDWVSGIETKGLVTDYLQFNVLENQTGANRQTTIQFMSKKTHITSQVTLIQFTLPVLGNTSSNCYIISEPGEFAIPLVIGNTALQINNAQSANIEWESYCTNEDISVGSIISQVSLDNGFIRVRTSTPLQDGNALVSVKDDNGVILWSWHLWCCLGYNPIASGIVLRYDAGILMDRNVGATTAIPGSVRALGLLYEWGRKDPFLNGNSISFYSSYGQTIAKSSINWPNPIKATPEIGTVEYSIANPTTYIYGEEADDLDWHYGSRDNSLWQPSTKTIYDPCPPGWRVPDGGNLNIWRIAGFNQYSLSNDIPNRGVMYIDEESGTQSWYPKSGTRGCLDGRLGDVGFAACYHTNAVTGKYAQVLYFNDASSFIMSDYAWRDNGGAIRCQKE